MLSYSQVRAFFSREWLLMAYLVIFLVILALYAPSLSTLISYINLRVVFSIFGFLVVVQGLHDSGFLSWLANRLALRAGDARTFALVVVMSTVALAAFVTNDLALFTFVPLVLAAPLQDSHKFRLLVLLALAANVGAFISPVGNPQKLILWQLSEMDILSFTLPFVLPFLVLAIGLIAYVLVLIPQLPIRVSVDDVRLHRHAAVYDALLFVGYLGLLAFGQWAIAVGLVFAYFILRYPSVFTRIDWAFLVLLILLFVDFGLLSAHFDVSRFFSPNLLSSPRSVFFISAALTQLFSDVPTAILLSHYSKQYVAIAMGTTVGAMGLIVASVANIIAVRLSTERRKYLKFHLYSLPFFVFAVAVVALFL